MSEWQLFPHMIVRTTGFPWELLDGVRCEKAVDAARRLIWERAAFEEYRHSAPRMHRPPKAVLSALRSGRAVPLAEAADPELFEEWNRRVEARERAEEEFAQILAVETLQFEQALRGLADDPRLLEAIASSSPPVYLDLERGRWGARLERQLASYMQRVAAKNETMSFFGAINYGSLQPEAPAGVAYTWSGPGHVAGRNTYAASWLVTGLFRTIAFHPQIAPWLVLRRKGFSQAPTRAQRRQRLGDVLLALGKVTPGQVREALGRQVDDRRRFGELLVSAGACTPEDVERGLAIQAGREPMPDGVDPSGEDREDLLPKLVASADGTRNLVSLCELLSVPLAAGISLARTGCDRGLLTHQLEVPAASHHPVDDLLERLGGIPGPAARTQVGRIAELRRMMLRYGGADARQKVALNEEVRELARRHWDLPTPQTGPPNPAAGKREQRGEGHNFYVDRLPLREECGGDLDLVVSGERAGELQSRMVRPLELMAYGAVKTQRAARALVANLLGRRTLPFWKVVAAFSDKPIPLDQEVPSAIAEAVDDPLAPIVHLDGLSSFQAEELGLPVITSIDLLIAAPDLAAWSRGEYEIVVGDVHDTALVWGWALQFHPRRREVEGSLLAELGVLPRPMPLVTALASRRTGLLPSEFPGPVIEIGGVSERAAAWRLPLDDLEVQSDGAEVKLWSRSLSSEVCLYNGELESLVHTAFALPRVRSLRVSLGAHTPRLMLGSVVLQRESWQLGAEQGQRISAARDDSSRLLAAVQVWDELGLPEHVFAKFKGERKPILVDVRSPLLLRVFANLLEQKGEVSLSEMYPNPTQLWLRGDRGRHTSELRCSFFRAGRGE